MDQLLCPNCGHHVANVKRDNGTGRSADADRGLREFLETLESEKGSKVQATELQDAYAVWAANNDGAPLSYQGFGRAMSRLGVPRLKSNGRRYYGGIRFPAGGAE